MSESIGFSDMPLSDAEKTDMRRFCGYPAIGATASGENSWRFFQTYGALEWRMSNLSSSELVQARTYVAQILPLEVAILGASANLDTDQAAVWKHNANETRDRMSLFCLWRRRLCGFLGVPPGPDLQSIADIII